MCEDSRADLVLPVLYIRTYCVDCFSRGLLRESLGQLAGLKRRKLALEMLGAAVQTGLNRRIASDSDDGDKKRSREGEDDAPATKKAKTESS